MKKYLADEAQTLQIGEEIGSHLEAGDVVILTGELGAGKTTLTKGIAKGLGITQMIKSPTYTIVREYTQGSLPLYHMDVYRLTAGDGESFGLEEYYEQNGVVIIEWGHNLASELPQNYLEIKLSYEENGRVIELVANGKTWQTRIAAWENKI